ncbi:MAG: intracellular proteinase inhibitor [Bacillota bacterium]|jgi:GH35 family endo-1,4-beta-xylanase|nr:intracellular proteinase inhibitor [Bacillota bacterium]
MRVIFILLALLMAAPLIDSKAASMQPSKESDQVYRKIYKLGYMGNYVITGEAKGSFYYSVEDGHVQYIQEKKVDLKGKQTLWHPFKIMINIPKTALPENGSVIVTFYKKEGKTGTYPIVLEQFFH